jgi:peroxiredoxin
VVGTTRSYDFDPAEAHLSMLVFFNPSDCAPCLLEAFLWRDLAQLHSPALAVIGIITEDFDERRILVFCRVRGLTFPVLLDKHRDVAEAFGVTRTPTRVLVDSDGRILDAGFSSPSKMQHELYKHKVAMLLRRGSSPAGGHSIANDT